MANKSFSSPALGISLQPIGLKGAVASVYKGRVSIDKLFLIEADPVNPNPEDVKPLYMAGQKELFLELQETALPTTALAASDVLTRQLQMTLTKEKDINQVLPFEVETLLPFSLDEAVLDKEIVSSTKEGSQVTVFAAKKEDLVHHLEQMSNLDIEPEVVSCTPFALAAFAREFVDSQECSQECSQEPLIALHIGWKETCAVLIHQGKFIASHSSNTNLWQLLTQFAGENNPLEVLNSFYKEVPSSSLDSLVLEVKRVIFALAKQFKGDGVSQILLTGDGVKIAALKEKLLQKGSLSEASLLANGYDHEQLLSYAISIGLAISSLPLPQNQINFRQAELSYPRPLKRMIRPLVLLFAASVLFSIGLYFYSKTSVTTERRKAKTAYIELLQTLGTSYEEFENTWKRERPSARSVSIEQLTTDELSARVREIEKQQSQSQAPFSLHPNIPRVADLLAWLSTHPLIKGEERMRPKLKIDSLTYKMVKLPSQSKPNEHYQVKVDLDFTAASPRYAREFHEALMAPNEMVDPSTEVQWSADREKFRTSFFLKDKTIYPRG